MSGGVISMLHHLSLPVTDLKASKRLYDAIMVPLGYRCVFAMGDAVGYGAEPGKDRLCLKLRPRVAPFGGGFHLALTAPSHAAVDEFFVAATCHGAKGDGNPGYRPAYGADYYAAFVIDLDGHRLEAVCK